MKQQEFKGEITVFLSLIFVLLLSFVGGILQSASIYITKSMKRADTELALESVFAEYETKVLEEYDLFVKLDPDEAKLSRRLWFYGAKNMEHKIQKIQLLTDSSGQAFYEQAVRSLGGEIPTLQKIPETAWENDAKEVRQELEEILSEGEESLPTENNPLESVRQLKESDFLPLVISEPETLSNRYVVLGELPSCRQLNQGTKHFMEGSTDGMTQKLLFMKYLDAHFPNYLNTQKGNSLFYEAEYLLEGKESDQENLEAVLKKILTIRTGINYAYLLTDQTKQAEAETMAAGLCSVLTIPGITPLVKQAILFAWSYAEGIQDLRVLTAGKKVPLVKSEDTWQLSLEGVMQMSTTKSATTEKEPEKGMGYADYLQVFLATEKVEELSMRALDLIELKMGVRVDGCVTAVQIKSTCKMQRDIQDTFITEYQYK